MANFAAGDVTYTIISQSRDARGRRVNVVKLAFGDSALTYATGGIPLTKAKMGCPTVIDALIPFDSAAASVGYTYQYDKTNEKLLMIQSPVRTHAHDLLVKGGQIGSTTNDIAHYATDILGKEAATDATILGSASGTKGGVVSTTLAAAAGSEPNAVAIVAQAIHCMVIGW